MSQQFFWKSIAGERKETWVSASEKKAGITQLFDNLFGSSQPVFMHVEDDWPWHIGDMKE